MGEDDDCDTTGTTGHFAVSSRGESSLLGTENRRVEWVEGFYCLVALECFDAVPDMCVVIGIFESLEFLTGCFGELV